MQHRSKFTTEERELFDVYFNVADEIFVFDDDEPDEHQLTLDDLEPEAVEKAQRAAELFGLEFPPYLPAAEEFGLDNREALLAASDDEVQS